MKQIISNFPKTFDTTSKNHPICIKTGKIPYATKKIALNALHRIKNSYKYKTVDHKIPYRVYYCEYCGAWHLTSMTLEQYQQIQNGEEIVRPSTFHEAEQREKKNRLSRRNRERIFEDKRWAKTGRGIKSMLKIMFSDGVFKERLANTKIRKQSSRHIA